MGINSNEIICVEGVASNGPHKLNLVQLDTILLFVCLQEMFLFSFYEKENINISYASCRGQYSGAVSREGIPNFKVWFSPLKSFPIKGTIVDICFFCLKKWKIEFRENYLTSCCLIVQLLDLTRNYVCKCELPLQIVGALRKYSNWMSIM